MVRPLTPERAASDAMRIAGVVGPLAATRIRWPECPLDDPFSDWHGKYIDADKLTPASRIQDTRFDYVDSFNVVSRLSGGVMAISDDTIPFMLATKLVLRNMTPAHLNTNVLLGDDVFHVGPISLIVADAPFGITTSYDVPIEFPKPRRAKLRMVERSGRRSHAFAMFSDLRDWLSLTTEETATLIGVGRTTPLAWERSGHEPRPAHARRLYQAYSIVSSLVERLGKAAATEWLESGDPSPRALLQAGDIAGVTDAAEQILIVRGSRTELPELDEIVADESARDDTTARVVPFPSAKPRGRRGAPA